MSGDRGRIPTAVVRRERRLSLAWLVPAAALVLAAWLLFAAWRDRGVVVIVRLPEGHGLKVGDPVRHRGINVGEVREIELEPDADGVVVLAALQRRAGRLARAGTRFWVVRPRVRLTRIEGLETLIGPRYLAVVPGNDAAAARQREFVGLAEAPVVDAIEPGDLELVVEAARRGALQPGAPVTYRQVRVGTVVSVGLASDGGTVEATLHVEKAFRSLVRAGSRFWAVGGIRADLKLSGVSIELESLEELLEGGVAFATPPPDEAGEPVRTGQRFPLAGAPDDDWLEWSPVVPVGSSLLPAGAALPQPLRATLGWRQGFILKGARARYGWVLPVEDGILGPADLLTAPEAKRAEDATLEVAGQAVPLADPPAWSSGGLARRADRVTERWWPATKMRRPGEPEDCVAVGDHRAAPFPLAAARLTAEEDGGWRVDAAVSLDDAWHGAAVLSRADGALVGILLIEEERVRVALLSGPGG